MIRLAVAALALVSIDLPGKFVPFADIPAGPSAEAVKPTACRAIRATW